MKIRASEALASINAFDEIAIARAFGSDITELQSQPFMFLRALAFVQFRRDGAKDSEAKAQAFALTIRDCNEFFEEEPADADLDGTEDPKA